MTLWPVLRQIRGVPYGGAARAAHQGLREFGGPVEPLQAYISRPHLCHMVYSSHTSINKVYTTVGYKYD